MGALKNTMITVGAMGAAAGLAYLSMKPEKKKKIERDAKRTAEEFTDMIDDFM